MPSDLSLAYEARRPLLEHVAHALEGEVRESLSTPRVARRIAFRVASADEFLASAQHARESRACNDPLVEIEDQIAGRVQVLSPTDVADVERRLQKAVTVVQAAWQEAEEGDETEYPLRRLTCLVPPQVKPPGWDGRDDVPKTFDLTILTVLADRASGESDERQVMDAPPFGQPSSSTEAAADGVGERSGREYDVFLAYNHADKPNVQAIADELQKRGLKVWLDVEEIPPGRSSQQAIQDALQRVRAFAIFISPNGLGRWQAVELRAAISQCVKRGIPVIPVLLPGVCQVPDALPLLAEFNSVRFVQSASENDNVERLVWGITGKNPTMVLPIGSEEEALTSSPPTTPIPAQEPLGNGKPGLSRRVLFALHGIRTHAGWTRALYEIGSQHGWQVRTDRWNFGYFSAIRFLLPSARSAKVRWFRRTYREEVTDRTVLLDEGRCPSIVAHSFGTYILGNALLKYDWLRFDKVILCGSILPLDFPWDKLIERGQVQAVRNEYGVQDVWSGLVRWFVAGTGPSGRDGFRCDDERLEQERFLYTHSEYFDKGQMEAKWFPFLGKALPVISPAEHTVSMPRTTRPWVLYSSYALLVALLVFGCLRLLPFGDWLLRSWSDNGAASEPIDATPDEPVEPPERPPGGPPEGSVTRSETLDEFLTIWGPLREVQERKPVAEEWDGAIVRWEGCIHFVSQDKDDGLTTGLVVSSSKELTFERPSGVVIVARTTPRMYSVLDALREGDKIEICGTLRFSPAPPMEAIVYPTSIRRAEDDH